MYDYIYIKYTTTENKRQIAEICFHDMTILNDIHRKIRTFSF